MDSIPEHRAPWGESRRGAGGWIAGVLALGVLARLLLQFPVHRYPGDADCVMTGFLAEKILAGTPIVFLPTGFRLGAIGAYVVAGWYAVLGPGREALAAAVVLVSSLQLILWWRFVENLAGRAAAAVVLPLLAVPTPAVAEWACHRPNSNPETFLLCAAVLWLGSRVARRGWSRGAALLLGVLVGIGFWASALTLGVSWPLLLWLAWVRREVLRRPDLIGLLALGGFAGSAPWFAFNVLDGWPSLSADPAAVAVTGLAAALRNLGIFLGYRLPQVVASPDGRGLATTASGFASVLWIVALAAPVLSLAILARRRPEERADGPGPPTPGQGLALAMLVFVGIGSLNVLAGIASKQGVSLRYALPLALVVPLVHALAYGASRSWRRSALLSVLVLVFTFQVFALRGPWAESRQRWEAELEDNLAMASAVERAGVEVVFGPYWSVDSLVFDAGYRFLGMPLEPAFDFRRTLERLPPRLESWALVGTERQVRGMASRLGLQGGIFSVHGRRALFIAPPAPGSETASRELLDRLRTAAHQEDLRGF